MPRMCRVCLMQNAHLDLVTDNNLHDIYERLSDIPFTTGDRRPMLACPLCCAKLSICSRLQRQCLEAEKSFSEMMQADNEPNPSINRTLYDGDKKSTPKNISIDDDDQSENVAIEEEVPGVCEDLEVIEEPEEEHQSGDLEHDEHIMDFAGNSSSPYYASGHRRACSSVDEYPLGSKRGRAIADSPHAP